MEEKKITIDYQRMTASISLKEESPAVIVVNQGDAAAYQLPDYGELTVKVHDGKVAFVDITEKHKY